MKNLLDYFGAAYLINLPERKDRLKSATKEFARAGWTFGSGGVQLYKAQRFADRAGFPHAAARGCFYSHWECIRTAHLLGKKSLLVMEDDIGLASSIGQLTPSIISELEAVPWDFLYLGHENTGEIRRATSSTSELSLAPFNDEIICLHFYAINSRVFSRLLAHLERVVSGVEGDQEYGPMPIDGAFNIFRRNNSDVRTLIAKPKLGWQLSSRSDNHPKGFDNVKLLRPLVSLLRNIKSTTRRWYS